MKIVKNRDRTGLDKTFYNGFKTEDGKYYFIAVSTGFGKRTYALSAADFEKVYDAGGNRLLPFGQIEKMALAQQDGGVSEQVAAILYKKIRNFQNA